MDTRAWDERYAASRQWSVTPNQFVAAALRELPPARALDLACGEGRNAIWLASLGWDVTAVDFSGVGVERGRSAAQDAGLEVRWMVGDVLTDPLPETDLVVLAYLQLPDDQRRTAVRRAWQALAPGGTFFLVAHDSTNLAEGSGGPQDPEVLYTAEDVLDDLADVAALGASDSVVRAERVARLVTADDDHGGVQESFAWDALVHVSRGR